MSRPRRMSAGMQLFNLNQMIANKSRHATDTIDVHSLMDNTLSLGENRANIAHQLGISFRNRGAEQHERQQAERARERKRRANPYFQVGISNEERDRKVHAKAPGRRISRTGRRYYERRSNRSDKPPGWL